MANFNRNLTILLHMKKYCEQTKKTIEHFGNDYSEFKDNFIYQNAISMAIFEVCELASHLTLDYIEETKNEMNWNVIRGMRNRFGHEYLEMDFEIIFQTAVYDIPKLKEFIEREIERLSK